MFLGIDCSGPQIKPGTLTPPSNTVAFPPLKEKNIKMYVFLFYRKMKIIFSSKIEFIFLTGKDN